MHPDDEFYENPMVPGLIPSMDPIPADDSLHLFWAAARQKVGLTSWEDLIGAIDGAPLMPATVQLAEHPIECTELAWKVAAGEVTHLTSSVPKGSSPSVIGDLMIVCDADWEPVALVQVVNAQISDAPDGRVITETFECLYAQDRPRAEEDPAGEN